MPLSKEKQEEMIFDYYTTYEKHYHREPYDKRDPVTLLYNKPERRKSKLEVLKDIHTMSHWKTRLPFTLWHKPKEIISTTADQTLKTYASMKHLMIELFAPKAFQLESVEKEHKQAQSTRPRLVMSPAIAVDDLEDEQRQHFINYVYNTTTERILKASVPDYHNVKAPLPGTLATFMPEPIGGHTPQSLPCRYQLQQAILENSKCVLQNLLQLKLSSQSPLVSPEWRWDSVQWEGRQIRGRCDPTRLFWLSQQEPKCTMCDQYAQVIEQRHNENL